MISIRKNKKYHLYRLNRIVAQTFIPNPNNYDEVNHIDGNTKNNALTNLEWCSHKMNVKHATQIIKVFDNYGKHTTNSRKKVAGKWGVSLEFGKTAFLR